MKLAAACRVLSTGTLAQPHPLETSVDKAQAMLVKEKLADGAPSSTPTTSGSARRHLRTQPYSPQSRTFTNRADCGEKPSVV
jgi:hypothetical protein